MRNLFLGALLAVAACGDGGTVVPDAGPDATPFDIDDLTGTCAHNMRVGEILVTHNPGENEGGFTARIETAPQPLAATTVFLEEGECQILEKLNPFCDPICELGMQCSIDEECISMIRLVPVGTVTLTGIGDAITLGPNSADYYQIPQVDLPFHLANPPFEVDARVRFQASGGEGPAFDLRGIGVTPIELPAKNPFIRREEPLLLEWNAPAVEGATVRLLVTVDQHGVGSAFKLQCLVPDTGSYTISAEMIEAFLNGGLSGFPNLEVERFTADRIELDVGCTEMRTQSKTTSGVTVEGHTPCNASTPCPKGFECNLATETCE